VLCLRRRQRRTRRDTEYYADQVPSRIFACQSLRKSALNRFDTPLTCSPFRCPQFAHRFASTRNLTTNSSEPYPGLAQPALHLVSAHLRPARIKAPPTVANRHTPDNKYRKNASCLTGLAACFVPHSGVSRQFTSRIVDRIPDPRSDCLPQLHLKEPLPLALVCPLRRPPSDAGLLEYRVDQIHRANQPETRHDR